MIKYFEIFNFGVGGRATGNSKSIVKGLTAGHRKNYYVSGSKNSEVNIFCEIWLLNGLSPSLEWMTYPPGPDGGRRGGALGNSMFKSYLRSKISILRHLYIF